MTGRADRWIAGSLILIAASAAGATIWLPAGARLVPLTVTVALLAALCAVFVRSNIDPGLRSDGPPHPPRIRTAESTAVSPARREGAALMWVIAFPSAILILGFPIGAAAYLLAHLRWVNRDRWVTAIPAAGAIGLIVWFVLSRLYFAPPMGFLPHF